MAALRKKPEDDKKLMLRGNIEMHQTKMRISNEKMAAVLAINAQTYRRKVLHPELFTYLELIKVFTILKFTEEEKLESI